MYGILTRNENNYAWSVLKSIFIWQQTAKLKYLPSSTNQTNSSNMMIDNLKTPLKVFSDILQK